MIDFKQQEIFRCLFFVENMRVFLNYGRTLKVQFVGEFVIIIFVLVKFRVGIVGDNQVYIFINKMGNKNETIHPKQEIINLPLPIQYKQIKCESDMLLGKDVFLIKNTQTQQYFTAKIYELPLIQRLSQNQPSTHLILNKILAYLFQSNSISKIDYHSILGNKNEIINIKEVFEIAGCQKQKNMFMLSCEEKERRRVGLVLECLEISIEEVEEKREKGFSMEEIVRVMECVVEGLLYLQYYNIKMLPICKKSIFLQTSTDSLEKEHAQDLSSSNFKVLPLKYVEDSQIENLLHYFHFPPQINLALPEKEIFSSFTIKNHLYCLGMTMIDLLLGDTQVSYQCISRNKQLKLNLLKEKFRKSKRKMKLVKLLGDMVEQQVNQRIGITYLLNQLQSFKNTNYNLQQHFLVRDISSQTINHSSKKSIQQFIKSSRENNTPDANKIRSRYKKIKSSHNLLTITTKQPQNFLNFTNKINNNLTIS